MTKAFYHSPPCSGISQSLHAVGVSILSGDEQRGEDQTTAMDVRSTSDQGFQAAGVPIMGSDVQRAGEI